MPNALIHLTSIEQLTSDPKIHPEIGAAMFEEIPSCKLGAVLIDLPSFEGFYGSLLRRFMPVLDSLGAPQRPWVLMLQTHRPTFLGFAFAEVAQTDLTFSRQRWPEAFVAGYFAHLAFDRIINAVNDHLIADLTKNDLEAKPNILLQKAQFIQMLHLQREVYGKEVIGTRTVSKMARLLDDASRDKAEKIFHFIERGFIKAFGYAPQKREIKRWLNGFSHYAQVMEVPLVGFVNLKDQANVERLKNAFFKNDFFDYMEYHKRAMELATDYINTIFGYMRSGDFTDINREEYMELIPEVDILHPPDDIDLYYTSVQSEAEPRLREEEDKKVLPFTDPRKK